MDNILRFESARDVVRHAYYKATAASAALLASSAGLIYGAYRMAEYSLKMAENNPNPVSVGESLTTIFSLLGGYIGGGMMGIATVIGVPIAFWRIHAKSRAVTSIDKGKKKIYQSGTRPFKLAATTEYDTIISVIVDQGPLEKRAKTGSVLIETLNLVDDGYGRSRVKTKQVIIPYQVNPHKVREQIAQGLPTNADLVQRLRG